MKSIKKDGGKNFEREKTMKDKDFNSKSQELKTEKDKSNPNLRLPKNINEYKYLIDTFLSRDTDIEWIFDLRGYQKKNNFMNLKNTSINQPAFYQDDYEKYRKKVEKDLKQRKDNPLKVKGNIGQIEHLVSKRLDLPSNPTQFGFDGTLRQFQQFETVSGPSVSWKSLSMNKKKNLLDTFLPPMTKNNIRNLSNINKYVSRPYEATRENASVNGVNISSRYYDQSKNLTSVVAGEHYSSQPYSYKYPDKNLNNIRHLIHDGNLNSLTKWESGLRGYKKYPTKKELERHDEK